MSKQLNFRARALDASKPMPVYKADDIPELPDIAAINRAVPQMPTGMEKEEETEHHLQRALSAQQVYGTAERLVIPIPEVDSVTAQYSQLYKISSDYKPPKQFIHVQPWGMDQEIPDYDMDSEDETWLTKQSKNFKNLSLGALKFENMMDRLEKGSGQTVVTLHEAKALLKEDDDLTIAVYDYWLNKRLRLEHALIPQVKTEKRDGSTTNNPYVAFRRRTEKMQTRKNRKNDESSYEKMLKLKRDLSKALTILELMKRREKSKKELLKLTIEIVEKRYQMNDYEGSHLTEALAQRHSLPSFIPLQTQYLNRDWGHKEEVNYVKKKREYKKRKHKHQVQVSSATQRQQLPHYTEVLPADPTFSSEDEPLSPPLSPVENDIEDDPDGIYAFKRKEGCQYHAPISHGLGDWPWSSRQQGGAGDDRFRYSLASVEHPRKCIGFVRRRIGRGGRVILDRAYTDWDDYLTGVDFTNSLDNKGWVKDYADYVNKSNIKHFRPQSPNDNEAPFGDFGLNQINPAFRDCLTPPLEFNAESYEDHQEQLLQRQRQQHEQLLKQEIDLDHSTNSLFSLDQSFSSTPTSRLTLDSATAQFAASALCNSTDELTQSASTASVNSLASTPVAKPQVTSLPTHSPALTALMTQNVVASQSSLGTIMISAENASLIRSMANGPVNSKTCGLSTSPAANILQLNYPLPVPVSSVVTAPTVLTPTTTIADPPTTKIITSVPMTTQLSSLSTMSSATFTLSSTSLISNFKTTLSTPKSLGTLTVSIPGRINQSKVTGIQGSTRLPTPTVLRLPAASIVKNENIQSRESHDGVNNIAKDNKVVAMEVT